MASWLVGGILASAIALTSLGARVLLASPSSYTSTHPQVTSEGGETFEVDVDATEGECIGEAVREVKTGLADMQPKSPKCLPCCRMRAFPTGAPCLVLHSLCFRAMKDDVPKLSDARSEEDLNSKQFSPELEF